MEILYSFAKLNKMCLPQSGAHWKQMVYLKRVNEEDQGTDGLYKGICRGPGSILNFAVAQSLVQTGNWEKQLLETRIMVAFGVALGKGMKPVNVTRK